MAGYYEKRGENKYRLVVDVGADFRGKRRRRTKTVTCTSPRQADKALAKFYTECTRENFAYSEKTTLSAFCEKWMNEYAATTAKKSTRKGYHSIIKANIAPLLGKHEIGKITPLHIQEWVNYLHGERNLSAKTLKNCHSLLSKIFASAASWGFVVNNPCDNITCPAGSKKETPFYNNEQVEVLLNTLLLLGDDRLQLKASVFLALFSGMRLGEIAGLKWKHADMDESLVRVRQTRYYNSGFGIYEDTPKTARSIRDISIPQICVDHLRQLKIQQLKRKLMLGQLWGDDQDYVFLNDYGAPKSPNIISRDFIKFLKKAGLPPLTFHGLRHTHTSMLVHMSLDIVQVSKRLGHSQLSTTQNIYTHLFEDTDRQIANKLENTFATFSPPKGKTST